MCVCVSQIKKILSVVGYLACECIPLSHLLSPTYIYIYIYICVCVSPKKKKKGYVVQSSQQKKIKKNKNYIVQMQHEGTHGKCYS